MSLSDVTLAASAKRNDGNPIDHNNVAKIATAAIAWSSPNVVFVLLIFTLRGISLQALPDIHVQRRISKAKVHYN